MFGWLILLGLAAGAAWYWRAKIAAWFKAANEGGDDEAA